jgi:putative endonuclease
MEVDENEPWSCYMLRCRDGSLYVGITNDVAQRVLKHNRGLGPEFTKRRRPVELLWSREFESRSAARRKETELKGWTRQKKLALVARTAGQGTKGDDGGSTLRPLTRAQGKGE